MLVPGQRREPRATQDFVTAACGCAVRMLRICGPLPGRASCMQSTIRDGARQGCRSGGEPDAGRAEAVVPGDPGGVHQQQEHCPWTRLGPETGPTGGSA
jgi:hypothetical protein